MCVTVLLINAWYTSYHQYIAYILYKLGNYQGLADI